MKFLVLLFLVLPAHAGVRLIHGGGGYAEMQALSVLPRLSKLIGFAMTSSHEPRLSPARFTLLSKLVTKARPPLVFERPEAGSLFIPSANLYDSDGAPLPAAQIATEVFVAWLQWAMPEIDSVDARALGAEVFKAGQVEEESVAWGENTLHALRLLGSPRSDTYLTLIDATGTTTDVTARLTEQLGCEQPHLVDVRGLHVLDQYVAARIMFACNGGFVAATVRLTPDFRATLTRQRAVTCGGQLEEAR